MGRKTIFLTVVSVLMPLLTTVFVVEAVELKELYQAAKAEGKVVMYTAPKPPWYKYALEGFKKKFPGISVEMITGGGGELEERFISEEVAGVSVADIWHGGITSVTRLVDTHNGVKPIIQPIHDLPSYKKSWLKDEKKGLWTTLDGFVYVSIAYNTKLVSSEQAPKSWQDLLAPSWKGAMTIRALSSGSLLTFWIPTFGSEEKVESFIKTLRDHETTFFSSSTKTWIPVMMGEKKIMIRASLNQVEMAKAEGRPVDWVHFKGQPLEVMPQPVLISKNAPHPNAAKLFTEYLLSKDGQSLFIKGSLFMPGNPEVDLSVIPSVSLQKLFREAFDGKVEYKSSIAGYERLTTLPKNERKRLSRFAAQLSR